MSKFLSSIATMKTTLSIVLFSILLSTVYSNSFRTRVLESSPSKFNCTGLPKKCDCPYPCLEQFEKQDYCVAKKCYKVDENLGQCKKSGTDHVAPLVLQAIPFTGVFGSGFANMGRWDLFGIYMAVFFGGCCGIIICASLFLLCCPTGEGAEKETGITCFGYCGSCLWAIAILSLYVIGIVMTATPGGVLDTDGCPLIF